MSKAFDNVVKLRSVFNLREFGAKGNGVFDDSLAFAAAVAATPLGATIVVDIAATLLTAYSGGSGRVLRFENGTISPAASPSLFTWQGSIDAPVNRQIFVGANLAQVRLTSEQTVVRLGWWGGGPNASGATNDAAIVALLNAVQTYPATWLLQAGAHDITTGFAIGNGTSTAVSTIHKGLNISGVAAGVGPGEYGTSILTSFRATGGSWTATFPAMMAINGGLVGVHVENVVFDCNSITGRAVNLFHLYKCRFVNVVAINQLNNVSSVAFLLQAHDNAAYASPYTAGTTQGFMECEFVNFSVRSPVGAASCIYMTGGKTNNTGFSRNVFRMCEWIRGNNAADQCLQYSFNDAITFESCFLIGTGLSSTGHAITRYTQASGPLTNILPGENNFHNCFVIGPLRQIDDTSFTATSNGGKDIAIGWKTSDGATTTMPNWLRVIVHDGRLLGGFVGSRLSFAGCSNSAGMSGSGFFALSGANQAELAARTHADVYMSGGGLLRLFRFNSGTVPGGSATRTIVVRINGVDTALLHFYNSAQNGDRLSTGAVSFNGGDLVSIAHVSTNGPASSIAYWAVDLEQIEVL